MDIIFKSEEFCLHSARAFFANGGRLGKEKWKIGVGEQANGDNPREGETNSSSTRMRTKTTLEPTAGRSMTMTRTRNEEPKQEEEKTSMVNLKNETPRDRDQSGAAVKGVRSNIRV